MAHGRPAAGPGDLALDAEVVAIALDLSAQLTPQDRYQRLLASVHRWMPCDATALLRLEGDTLVPLAVVGLRRETLGQRFRLALHPRLATIVAQPGPVTFKNRDLPDPFDGWLAEAVPSLSEVHACMGCALRVEGEVVGALTMDAADPHAFDGVDRKAFALLAALAGAALRTASLVEALERSARHSGSVVRQLLQDADGRTGLLVGNAPAMQILRADIEAVAGAGDVPVLVLGETGTGKELVARAIHQRSSRSAEPLIQVNCAALPEAIADSELFGHTSGAFTGAGGFRAGRFETADRGSLLLDEIGELPLSIQPRLLRALQFGEIQRVGCDRPNRVDVRIIAVTNRDLSAEAAAGRFRLDLFHRLHVFPVRIPPLRERREDIPLLAGHFLDLARARLGTGPLHLTSAAAAILQAQPWPGNVRELEHTVLRGAIRAVGEMGRAQATIRPEHLGLVGFTLPAPAAVAAEVAPGMPLSLAVEAFQRARIDEALRHCGGSIAQAARRLGLDRSNLHRLMGRLGLRGHDVST